MTQLEDFRSQLDESDPAALERSRTRLRAAQQASAPDRRPARTSWSRSRVAAIAGGAVAIALGAVLIGFGNGGDEAGLDPAPADARAVLVRAADSAADAHDGGLPRMPRPDEFYYLEIRGTYRDGIGARDGTMTFKLNTRTYRRWESLTRTGRIDISVTPRDTSVMRPTRRYYVGNERFSYDELAAFDPNPQELYRRLLEGVSPGQGSSPEAEVFVQLVDALRDVPLPPRLRATFLRALAEVPGLKLTGATKDSLGRPGLGFAYVERSRQDERHELILSEDGALLAVRSTTAGGALLEDAVVVRQAITDQLPG